MNKKERVKGYEELEKILDMAYLRAAKGKGRERHANDLPFTQQPIIKINALTQGGFALGQALKKLEEIPRLSPVDGVNEMLDVIVYSASWILEKLNPQGGRKIEVVRESGNFDNVAPGEKNSGEVNGIDWVEGIKKHYKGIKEEDI